MIAPKSRITEVEATVVQLLHIAVADKRAVIVCRGLFLLLLSGVEELDKQKSKY
jgi:hypothetical protein